MDVKKKIVEAIAKVETEIMNFKSGDNEYELSKSFLINVKSELEEMNKFNDKSKYQPSYPRFLLDYPETDLINYLIEVSYLYKQYT